MALPFQKALFNVSIGLGLKNDMIGSADCELFMLEVQMVLSKACNLFAELQAGMISLRDVVSINKPPAERQVQTFFIVMEVFGCGTELNLDSNGLD